MGKRGQVSVFVFIGIVIVVLVILFLFLRTRVYIGPATQQDLEAELAPIEDNIKECVMENVGPMLDELGRNGGYLDPAPGTYRLYRGNTVAYLCYNIQNRPYCRPRVLRLKDMEEQLEEALLEDLEECIDVQGFKKIGLDLESGELDIDIEIGEDVTSVIIDLPLKITKGDTFVELREFSVDINKPLGRLYDVMREAVNGEATVGDFETVLYSAAKTKLTSKLYYVEIIDKPYPDKLYMATIKDYPNQEDTYIFQFFIEGEPR
ncbi:MAG: hypothetical protein ABIB47_00435 [Candidatus Woesearchaeota archaeon]